jgi:hypothetical protein
LAWVFGQLCLNLYTANSQHKKKDKTIHCQASISMMMEITINHFSSILSHYWSKHKLFGRTDIALIIFDSTFLYLNTIHKIQEGQLCRTTFSGPRTNLALGVAQTF